MPEETKSSFERSQSQCSEQLTDDPCFFLLDASKQIHTLLCLLRGTLKFLAVSFPSYVIRETANEPDGVPFLPQAGNVPGPSLLPRSLALHDALYMR